MTDEQKRSPMDEAAWDAMTPEEQEEMVEAEKVLLAEEEAAEAAAPPAPISEPELAAVPDPVDPLDWSGLGLTDVDNTQRFISACGDDCRYVLRWAKWLVWDGQQWVVDNHKDVLITELAQKVPRMLLLKAAAKPTMSKDLTKQALALQSAAKLAQMVKLARGADEVLIDHEELDSNPWVLGTPNGYVDLWDGSFHDPERDMLITMSTRAEWDPEAKAPVWEKSLAEWMPDPEMRDYFQRLCGASIIGEVKDHLLVIIYGEGGNGKGTAFRAIEYVIGDYFVVPHKSMLIQQRFEHHDTVRASLFRKRMAVAGETDSNVKLNEASIKGLTGNDRMQARRMREDEWSFDPSHTLWLYTNNKPKISETGHAMWRRIRLLPWTAKFEGQSEDKELDGKLRKEASGVLNWLLEGVRKYQDVGLGDDTIPKVVLEATDEYRGEQDSIGRWLKEEGWKIDRDDKTLQTQSTVLQVSWANWSSGEGDGSDRFNEVSKRLRHEGCSPKKNRWTDADKNRHTTTVWQGIGYDTTNPKEGSEKKAPEPEPEPPPTPELPEPY